MLYSNQKMLELFLRETGWTILPKHTPASGRVQQILPSTVYCLLETRKLQGISELIVFLVSEPLEDLVYCLVLGSLWSVELAQLHYSGFF